MVDNASVAAGEPAVEATVETTAEPSPTGSPADRRALHRARVRRINRAIQAEERRLRSRHPWLARQDAVGLGLWLGSFACMVLVAAGWLGGVLPWWAAIPLMALPLSVLHELEHDLIHDLYFSKRQGLQDLMFLGIFLAKMSMDPWLRRHLHLRHHKESGQPTDIEERLIGLGLPYGPRRLLLTLVPAFAALQLGDLRRDLREARREQGLRGPVIPERGPAGRLAGLVGALFALLPFVVVPAALLGLPGALALLVLYVAPNTLRHASIAFVSSSSHYYGDIEGNDVYEQNQVLDHWSLWPLQLFCCNFGATHILHHYVVRQPFYLRHLVAPAVQDVLLAEGVPHNDLGTFARANRRKHAA